MEFGEPKEKKKCREKNVASKKPKETKSMDIRKLFLNAGKKSQSKKTTEKTTSDVVIPEETLNSAVIPEKETNDAIIFVYHMDQNDRLGRAVSARD